MFEIFYTEIKERLVALEAGEETIESKIRIDELNVLLTRIEQLITRHL